jgi:hypothetical protein
MMSNDITAFSRTTRRSVLRALGLAGVWTSASAFGAVPSLSGAHSHATLNATDGQPVRLSANALDHWVETFFPAFNHGNHQPPFSREKHAARYDVELRRIVTDTRVPETGERVKVSGLVAIPVGVSGPLPVVLWQHGTVLGFDQVPSKMTRFAEAGYQPSDATDSLETLFNLQRLAGQGFAIIAADYLGKGPYREERSEAYAVRDATVQTCLDVFDAGLATLRDFGHAPAQLFLNGWSQGGLNTQWLAQALRDRKIVVTAAATQCAFNNLVESVRYWTGQLPLNDSTNYPPVPGWTSVALVILLGSYRAYYGLPDLFKTAIKPKYQEFAETYWSTYALDGFDLSRAPTSAGDLLIDGILSGYTAESNSAFVAHLGRNTPAYQSYDFPIRFYYGLADDALHPSSMRIALTAAGSHATGIGVPNGSHRGAFISSLYGNAASTVGHGNVVDWFRSFL